MPIYEYECGSCEHTFETLRRINDDPLIKCPECGKPSLKKLVSAAAFRLKGKGWYETDFKTGNKKNVHQGDKKPDNKSATKSESKGKSGNTTTAKKSGGSK